MLIFVQFLMRNLPYFYQLPEILTEHYVPYTTFGNEIFAMFPFEPDNRHKHTCTNLRSVHTIWVYLRTRDINAVFFQIHAFFCKLHLLTNQSRNIKRIQFLNKRTNKRKCYSNDFLFIRLFGFFIFFFYFDSSYMLHVNKQYLPERKRKYESD